MKQIHHGQNVKAVVGFAKSLRDYEPKLNEKALGIINKELDKWKKIEATTSSNKKLDEAQDKIKDLERQAKRLSRQTIDSYRKEYQELSAKFNNHVCMDIFKLTLHKRFKKYGIHLRLTYQDGGFNTVSFIVRKDARKLFNELTSKCSSI